MGKSFVFSQFSEIAASFNLRKILTKNNSASISTAKILSNNIFVVIRKKVIFKRNIIFCKTARTLA